MNSSAPSKKSCVPPGVIIFVLALVLRLIWVLQLPNAVTWGQDETEYFQIGQRLAHGGGYVTSSLRANPGFPAYLALVFKVCGDNIVAARVGYSVLGALTCVLLYLICTRLVNRRAGWICAVLLAIYPAHIYIAGVLFTECLVTFLCALTVWLAVLAMQPGPRLVPGLLAGIALGATALTRSAFLVVVPFVWMAWLYAARTQWRKSLPLCAVFLVGCLATVLPWTYRNYRVYGRLIPVSSGFQTLLWRGNSPLSNGSIADRDLTWRSSDWQQRLQKLPEPQRRAMEEQYAEVERKFSQAYARTDDSYLASDEVLGPLAVHYVLSSPGRVMVLAFKKLITMYSAFSKTTTHNAQTTGGYKLIAALSFYPILALALLGMVVGLQRRWELAMIYLLLGSVTLSYILLATATRYRLPLDSYLILFAAVALDWAIQRCSEGNRSARPI